ncbi:hypothetical protein ABW20_dc0109738 [Dactylellina cionopaga]|nr:hypothetical protein ABW20_dc0109738 [Dactylellina cionopaga]
MSKPEIVVGIDFGTTYSGLSWATSTGVKDINLVTDWKRTKLDFSPTNDKVRTWISYKDNKPNSYGYEASGSPFKWFKILLQPGQYTGDMQYVKEANANLIKLGKSVDEIISEYFKWIWERGLEHIRMHQHLVAAGADIESIYSFKVVITVPAAWEPIAKERTLQAARKAGLPSNIKLVSEPEAAALSILKDKSNKDELKVYNFLSDKQSLV